MIETTIYDIEDKINNEGTAIFVAKTKGYNMLVIINIWIGEFVAYDMPSQIKTTYTNATGSDNREMAVWTLFEHFKDYYLYFIEEE